MTDDIVKYLRLSQTRFNRHAEAADEIERLRADRDNFLHLARRLYDLIPERSSEAIHRATVLRDYEEVANNELAKGLSRYE